MTIHVGYFVGSLSSTSINRVLSRALIRLVPEDMQFTELPIGNLPLYSPDYDSDFPAEARAVVGGELVRSHPSRRDRRLHRPDRDRDGAAEPPRGAQLLQTPGR
jgi:hypothetical protein